MHWVVESDGLFSRCVYRFIGGLILRREGGGGSNPQFFFIHGDGSVHFYACYKSETTDFVLRKD